MLRSFRHRIKAHSPCWIRFYGLIGHIGSFWSMKPLFWEKAEVLAVATTGWKKTGHGKQAWQVPLIQMLFWRDHWSAVKSFLGAAVLENTPGPSVPSFLGDIGSLMPGMDTVKNIGCQLPTVTGNPMIKKKIDEDSNRSFLCLLWTRPWYTFVGSSFLVLKWTSRTWFRNFHYSITSSDRDARVAYIWLDSYPFQIKILHLPKKGRVLVCSWRKPWYGPMARPHGFGLS